MISCFRGFFKDSINEVGFYIFITLGHLEIVVNSLATGICFKLLWKREDLSKIAFIISDRWHYLHILLRLSLIVWISFYF